MIHTHPPRYALLGFGDMLQAEVGEKEAKKNEEFAQYFADALLARRTADLRTLRTMPKARENSVLFVKIGAE